MKRPKQTDRIAPRERAARRRAGRVSTGGVEYPIGKRDAAEILGISTDTLDQWTVKYGIPHYKYDVAGNRGNRGKVVYLASDILCFREKYRVVGRDIVCQIATGLSDMHEAGRVHRDLKPANVLFDGKKRVKIIDLGLVRCRGEETIADDGMARGTLHYMSAEHLANPAAVDQRSDLYSLGVIFYRMATGTLPFDGAMAVDVQKKILHEEPIRPRVLSPGTSTEHEEVILRLLAKDPSRRFQSARLLLLHLNAQGPSDICPTCNAPMERGASYCPACGVDVRCAGSAPALLCVDAAAGPRWLVIPPEGRELGREALDPGNPAVSIRHARIFRKQRSWYLEDLGSTNGSWVDGRRLQSSQPLASRSFLQFANVTCVFWKKA
ncbi:MAG: protein kinase [Planctomycetes bacterium]|nr:protein kinase [Planctomycetota bacterium]